MIITKKNNKNQSLGYDTDYIIFVPTLNRGWDCGNVYHCWDISFWSAMDDKKQKTTEQEFGSVFTVDVGRDIIPDAHVSLPGCRGCYLGSSQYTRNSYL